jgi:hypothetical protein
VDHSSYVGQVTIAGHGERGVLVCGAYKLDMSGAHPLFVGLAEVINLPASASHHRGLRAAIDQLSAEMDQLRPGSDSIVAALIDLLLLHMLRACYEDQP